MTDVLSKCCGKLVEVACGNEGTNHYICTRCDKACDVQAKAKETWVKEFEQAVPPLQVFLEDGEETECFKFGYKYCKGSEIFTVTDWGNIKEFIRETREEAKREERERIKNLVGQLYDGGLEEREGEVTGYGQAFIEGFREAKSQMVEFLTSKKGKEGKE